MIMPLLAFAMVFCMFFFGIPVIRKLTGYGKLYYAKLFFYSLFCVIMSLTILSIIVFLF